MKKNATTELQSSNVEGHAILLDDSIIIVETDKIAVKFDIKRLKFENFQGRKLDNKPNFSQFSV